MHWQNVLESTGVSIWQMAVAPSTNTEIHSEDKSQHLGNGYLNDRYKGGEASEDSSESEDDPVSDEQHEHIAVEDPLLAIACDDGCVRIYTIPDSDDLIYNKTLPRVSGETSAPLNPLLSCCFPICEELFGDFLQGVF